MELPYKVKFKLCIIWWNFNHILTYKIKFRFSFYYFKFHKLITLCRLIPRILLLTLHFYLSTNLWTATVHSVLVKVLNWKPKFIFCLIKKKLEDLDSHEFENNFNVVIYNSMEPIIQSKAWKIKLVPCVTPRIPQLMTFKVK